MQNKEGVKARHFFMEDDMKKATGVLRMDKSGKILMTILRHLGRLQEVRTHLCPLLWLPVAIRACQHTRCHIHMRCLELSAEQRVGLAALSPADPREACMHSEVLAIAARSCACRWMDRCSPYMLCTEARLHSSWAMLQGPCSGSSRTGPRAACSLLQRRCVSLI